MANMPGIVIKVTSQVTDAVSGLNKVNRAMGKTSTGSQKFAAGMKGLAVGAAAAGAAVGAMAVAVGVDAVKAFNAEEDALATFHKTLENLGLKDHTADLDKWIDNLQFSANVADDELRPAFERLARSTDDVEASQRSLTTALDISAAVHKPLADVANALGKAWDGNRASLGRLGLGLDASFLKMASMDDILKKLAEDFGGQSDTSANTLTGAMHGVSIAWDELSESLGQGLVIGDAGTEADTVERLEKLEEELRRLQPQAERLGARVHDAGEEALGAADNLGFLSDALNNGDFKQAFQWVVAGAWTEGENKQAAQQEVIDAYYRLRDGIGAVGDEFDHTTAAAHRAARAIAAVPDVAATDPMGGSGVHDYYGRIQNDYVRGLQARGAAVRARAKRRAAKKADRAEAVAAARRAEIAKRRAEARTGNKFGAQKPAGRVSC